MCNSHVVFIILESYVKGKLYLGSNQKIELLFLCKVFEMPIDSYVRIKLKLDSYAVACN